MKGLFELRIVFVIYVILIQLPVFPTYLHNLSECKIFTYRAHRATKTQLRFLNMIVWCINTATLEIPFVGHQEDATIGCQQRGSEAPPAAATVWSWHYDAKTAAIEINMFATPPEWTYDLL